MRRRLLPRWITSAPVVKPACTVWGTAKRWCSTAAGTPNQTPEQGNDENAWTRDGWVASLPKSENRAPLYALEGLLRTGFTPGEMTEAEMKVYNGAHHMVAKAEQDKRLALKQKAEGKPAVQAESQEEKMLKDSPLAIYTKYYDDHYAALKLSAELIEERVKTWDDTQKAAFKVAADRLHTSKYIVRTLAEMYPKTWDQFLESNGKAYADQEELDATKASDEEVALFRVCKYFGDKIPEELLAKPTTAEAFAVDESERKGKAKIQLPPPMCETYWDLERSMSKGNLFLNSKSMNAAVNCVAGKLDQFYQELKERKAEAPSEFRILDAGCGAGNLGHNLQNALPTWGLLKSETEPNRPEISLFGFDSSLQVGTFLATAVARSPKIPHFNLYNKPDGDTQPHMCLDTAADRSALRKAYPNDYFDLVVSSDFLFQDPTMGHCGMSTMFDLFDFVKPGGSLLILNSLIMVNPAVLAGYSAMLSSGRDGLGKERLLDKVADSRFKIHYAPPRPVGAEKQSLVEELMEKQREVPVAVHVFTKKQ